MKNSKFIFASLLLIPFLAFQCKKKNKPVLEPSMLHNHSWQLDSIAYHNQETIQGCDSTQSRQRKYITIDLSISEELDSGFAVTRNGSMMIHAWYSINGDTISFEKFSRSDFSGEPTPKRFQNFVDALQSAKRYTIESSQLIISNDTIQSFLSKEPGTE